MPATFTRKTTSSIPAVTGAYIDSYGFIYEIMTRVPHLAELSLKNYVTKFYQKVSFEFNDLTLYQTDSLAK